MIFYQAALPPDSIWHVKAKFIICTLKAKLKVRTYYIQEREQQQNHLILRQVTAVP